MTELDLDMLELQGFESDSNHIDKYVQGFESLIQKQKQYGRILEMTGAESYTATVNKLNDITQTPMHGMENFVSNTAKKIWEMITAFSKRIWEFFFSKNKNDNMTMKEDHEVVADELKNLESDLAVDPNKGTVTQSRVDKIKSRWKTKAEAAGEAAKERQRLASLVINNKNDYKKKREAQEEIAILEAVASDQRLAKPLEEAERNRRLEEAKEKAINLVKNSHLWASWKKAMLPASEKVIENVKSFDDSNAEVGLGVGRKAKAVVDKSTSSAQNLVTICKNDNVSGLDFINKAHLDDDVIKDFDSVVKEAEKAGKPDDVSETDYTKALNEFQKFYRSTANMVGVYKTQMKNIKNLIRKSKNDFDEAKAKILAAG